MYETQERAKRITDIHVLWGQSTVIEQLEIDGDEERREHLTSIECAWEQRVHWAACHSFYCGYRAAVKVLTAVDGVNAFDMIPHTLLLEYHLGYTKSYDQTEQQHIDR